ncbi:MFS transporter [Streptomyces sp. NBC_01549]|uniref:MFS transporter n=1 Tax=Streptomyces sp. NBC_01549 TaxID=2975874 RepID=UPI00225B7009|nr:MFS transporter [Streptomyces sp. NBC_01549]MCX4591789.1 MFS transporter [Streptomyces sp. NBC_01549]
MTLTRTRTGTRTPHAAMLRSLSVRNFRLFAAGQIASATGTWMMIVVQDWLVLDLTKDSSTALATVTALQFTPVLLLTLYEGRLADRHDKRALLTIANLASGLLALLLTLLVLADSARLWQLYIFGLLTTAFAAGALLAAFAGTMRSSRPSARVVTSGAFALGLLETAAGWAPGWDSMVVLLTLTGFAATYFAQAANHRIQLGSDPRYRGRVLAVYSLILQARYRWAPSSSACSPTTWGRGPDCTSAG